VFLKGKLIDILHSNTDACFPIGPLSWTPKSKVSQHQNGGRRRMKCLVIKTL